MEVDGEKADLYKVSVEGKRVIAYVESWAGAEVALCSRMEMDSLPHDIMQLAIIDGIR